MNRLTILLSACILILSGCAKQRILKDGPWLGVIRIDSTEKNMDLPFNMFYEIMPDGQKVMQVSNASEHILITELAFSGDTLFMKFPVYTSEIIAVIRNDSLVGYYYPKGRDAGKPYEFYAVHGISERFPWAGGKPVGDVSGRWKITEQRGTDDSTIMVGEFTQDSSHVSGTILNIGGDYRYLEGKVSGNRFMLSAVDGAHTLILTADLTADGKMINGKFMGSRAWKSSWTAVRDESAKLPGMDQILTLREDSPPFTFRFPDLNGDTLSLSDERFRGKVTVVMGVGTWCPNCYDETVFFRDLYPEYREKGMEAVALCFEDKTFETSKPKIERFVSHTGATYPFLYAGPRGRANMQTVFYNLTGLWAYPTTIFIDRKGKIRKVESGFSGPGTGKHYQDYCEETRKLIEELLAEKP